jgi:CxxC-x17-CxxC domain-containing protein
MTISCSSCRASFEHDASAAAFLDKISPTFGGVKCAIPAPTKCPDCRLRQRLMFRNDLSLYHRKSDLSGKQIISIYAQDKPYKVYDQDEWWSDRWDDLAHGRPFDFNKTLTEQMRELNALQPHMSLFTTNAENSYYTNHSLNARNTYLVAGATNIEDCMYGRFVIDSKNCVDGLSLYNCQWCYESVASQGCYQCFWATYSYNCSDCIMVEDCSNCKNCCLCYGLKNQEYCFFNEKIGKEEYEKRMKELMPLTPEKIRLLREKLRATSTPLPHRASHTFGCENSSGDMLFNSRDCKHCFDCSGCEDCVYVWNTPKGITSRDCSYTAPDGVRFCYQAGSTVGADNSMGTFLCWYGGSNYYSREVHHCQNVFGCSGLKKKQYCILNKQYTKEEYEKLVPKIVEHMRKTGEWGEYLDPSLSTMAYNETLAQEFFPVTKAEAQKRGWTWYDGQDKRDAYMGPKAEVPEDITKVGDDVCDKIFTCRVTGKPFKIVPQELKFYRLMKLPLPKTCPDQRHKERMALRNPRTLWTRACAKCGKNTESTYAPDRKELVYCEDCYLKAVY